MREYDQIAGWYAEARSEETGLPDVIAFAESLPTGGRILDLGCGNGRPISEVLIRQGFQLVGLDSSAEMIARYRRLFPGVSTRCERIQDAHFDPGSFDAVVAWGVLFHLSIDDQKAVFARVADWLRPGGRFLFTAGDVEGTTTSEMDGVAFRYVSSDADGYRRALEQAGLILESIHRDAWDNVVYRARTTDLGGSVLTGASRMTSTMD